jgi:hypothetical protein
MEINKKHILYIVLILIISSCKNKIIHDGDPINNIDTIFICNLKENIDIISQVDDAKFINDSTFIIISNKQIIKYDTEGNQLNIIDKVGQAPNEYIMPSLMDVYGSSIYIWCSNSLKLIEYDLDGNFINAITNYKKAIKSFRVYRDEYIFFYKNGGTKEGIIDVYDIEKKQIIKTIGTYTDEDLLLSMMKFKPEMIILKEYLYFIRPSSLDIYKLNINNFELETFTNVSDNEYSISRIDNAIAIINTKRNQAFEYIYNNSLTDNIFLIENGLIVKTETGKYVIDKSKNEIDRSLRFNKFHLLKDNRNDKIWKTAMSAHYYNYINYNQDVYIIQNTLDNESTQSILFKINLP